MQTYTDLQYITQYIPLQQALGNSRVANVPYKEERSVRTRMRLGDHVSRPVGVRVLQFILPAGRER